MMAIAHGTRCREIRESPELTQVALQNIEIFIIIVQFLRAQKTLDNAVPQVVLCAALFQKTLRNNPRRNGQTSIDERTYRANRVSSRTPRATTQKGKSTIPMETRSRQ